MRELIVTFHGLGEPPPGVSEAERRVWVPVAWLDAVLDALPQRGVGVAFDDGNRSDAEHALPALLRAGRTGRFFVLAGQLGEAGRLTVSDVERLRGAGMLIGSHGLYHRDWRSVAGDELHRELVDSRRTLAGICGQSIDEAACPFGSYDRRVLGALRSAGYRRTFTSDGGSCSSSAWLAARTTITVDRPLTHWLHLVASGPAAREPVMRLKTVIKRLR